MGVNQNRKNGSFAARLFDLFEIMWKITESVEEHILMWNDAQHCKFISRKLELFTGLAKTGIKIKWGAV